MHKGKQKRFSAKWKSILRGMMLQPTFNRHFREREQRNDREVYKEIMDKNFSEIEKNSLQKYFEY